ncbi:MAG: DUF115 domain-containing protein [Rhodospirillaceae bacterium]|nr:DUF115 domain-containing protein [Rhodospirillaceae bacterium]
MEFSDTVLGPVDLSAGSGTARVYARAVREAALPAPVGRIGREELRARVNAAMARGLPTTLHCINTAKEWAVVGGGPSINDHVDTIRALKRRGVAIVSVNKTHDWLLGHGIVPWGHVLLDPKDWVAGYVTRPRKDVRYLVASQCHGDVFDALKDYPVFLWHAGQDFPEDGVNEPDAVLRDVWAGATWQIVPGGTTVGLRTPMLGHHMSGFDGRGGVDRFHMIGFDSCRSGGKLHGYEKPEAKDAASGLQKIVHKGKKYCFDTNSHMARQFVDFDAFMGELEDHYAAGKLRRGFQMKFYGRGLLPFYAAMLGLHAEGACNAAPERVGGFMRVENVSA